VTEESTGTAWDDVAAAILEQYATRYELEEASLDEQTLALARRLAPEHRVSQGSSRPSQPR
jgi:hypothetical protein